MDPADHKLATKLLKGLLRQQDIGWLFKDPVDPSVYHDYPSVVAHPMSLSVMKKKLSSAPQRAAYADLAAFSADVQLICDNARLYNAADRGNPRGVCAAADLLQQRFEAHRAQLLSAAPAPAALAPVAALAPEGAPVPAATGAGMADGKDEECAAVYKKVTSHRGTLVRGGAQFVLATDFMEPVDLAGVPDYAPKIARPLHFNAIRDKLLARGYADSAEFASDMRTVLANCLVYYGPAVDAPLRQVAVRLLEVLERALARAGVARPGVAAWQPCLELVETLLRHRRGDREGDEAVTAFVFSFRLEMYWREGVPADYYEKVPKPSNLGLVTHNLVLGNYDSLGAFAKDVRLIFSNCYRYWTEESAYSDNARLLQALFDDAMPRLSAAIADQAHASQAAALAPASGAKKARKPKKVWEFRPHCEYVIERLLAHRTRGPLGEVPTADPFYRAVDLSAFPDYLSFVEKAMYVKKVQRNLESNRYSSMDDFRADMHLIVANCLLYNADTPGNADIRFLAHQFKRRFDELYAEVTAPGFVPPGKKPPQPSPSPAPAPIPAAPAPIPAAPAPIPAAAPPPAPAPAAAPPHTPAPIPAAAPGLSATPATTIRLRPPSAAVANGAALPLSRSSSAYPSPATLAARANHGRGTRDLSDAERVWERVLRRLLRHEWVAQFGFNVPVVEAFPALRDAYLNIVARPMDLGTVENRLYARELTAESFVGDITLVFDNAVAFNSGEDELSCKVRDSARHLRAFFLELCTELCVTQGRDARDQARARRHAAVGPHIVDSTTECRKALKTINSQKFKTDSWPFAAPVAELNPEVMLDYSRHVKRPMDLRTIDERLKKNLYRTYGEFVDDMRLVFDNAMLYNKRDTNVTGRWTVYHAAKRLKAVFDDTWGDISVDVWERVQLETVPHSAAKRRKALADAQEKLNLAALRATSVPPAPAPSAPQAQPAADDHPHRAAPVSYAGMDAAPPRGDAAYTAAFDSDEEEEQRRRAARRGDDHRDDRLSKERRRAEEKRRKKQERDDQLRQERQRHKMMAEAIREGANEARRRAAALPAQSPAPAPAPAAPAPAPAAAPVRAVRIAPPAPQGPVGFDAPQRKAKRQRRALVSWPEPPPESSEPATPAPPAGGFTATAPPAAPAAAAAAAAVADEEMAEAAEVVEEEAEVDSATLRFPAVAGTAADDAPCPFAPFEMPCDCGGEPAAVHVSVERVRTQHAWLPCPLALVTAMAARGGQLTLTLPPEERGLEPLRLLQARVAGACSLVMAGDEALLRHPRPREAAELARKLRPLADADRMQWAPPGLFLAGAAEPVTVRDEQWMHAQAVVPAEGLSWSWVAL